MSFIALVNSDKLSLSTDQLVLSPREISTFSDAAETGDHLTILLEKYEQKVLSSKNKGFSEGFKEGKDHGLLEAREKLAEQLAEITSHYQIEQQKMKMSVVKLAMQVVRRVAGEIGSPDVVAGIAQKAADDLIADDFLILQVHPSAVEKVKLRLQNYTVDDVSEIDAKSLLASAQQQAKPLYIEVRAGESLSEFECLINTKFGTTVAGLNEQLACLEKIITKKLIVDDSQVLKSNVGMKPVATEEMV